MKRYGRPGVFVTDRLRCYGAVMKVFGTQQRHVCDRWLNNRAENSHQPFRRREGAMARFQDIKTLQKVVSVHAPIHKHFKLDRHLNRRDVSRRIDLPPWPSDASWRPESLLFVAVGSWFALDRQHLRPNRPIHPDDKHALPRTHPAFELSVEGTK